MKLSFDRSVPGANVLSVRFAPPSSFAAFDGRVRTATKFKRVKTKRRGKAGRKFVLRVSKYRSGAGHPPCDKRLKDGGRSPGLLRKRYCAPTKRRGKAARKARRSAKYARRNGGAKRSIGAASKKCKGLGKVKRAQCIRQYMNARTVVKFKFRGGGKRKGKPAGWKPVRRPHGVDGSQWDAYKRDIADACATHHFAKKGKSLRAAVASCKRSQLRKVAARINKAG